jgi:hypothetical protein
MGHRPPPTRDVGFLLTIYRIFRYDTDFIILFGKIVRNGFKGFVALKGLKFLNKGVTTLCHTDYQMLKRQLSEDFLILSQPGGLKKLQEKYEINLEERYEEIYSEYVRLSSKLYQSKALNLLEKPLNLIQDVEDLSKSIILQKDLTDFEEKTEMEIKNVSPLSFIFTRNFKTIEELLSEFDKTKRIHFNTWQEEFLQNLNLYTLGRSSDIKIFKKKVPVYFSFIKLIDQPFFKEKINLKCLVIDKNTDQAILIPKDKIILGLNLHLNRDFHLNRSGFAEEQDKDDDDFSSLNVNDIEEGANTGKILNYLLKDHTIQKRPIEIKTIAKGFKEKERVSDYLLISPDVFRMKDLDFTKFLDASERMLGMELLNQDMQVYTKNTTLSAPLLNLYNDPNYYNQDTLFIDDLYFLDLRNTFGSFVLKEIPFSETDFTLDSKEFRHFKSKQVPRLISKKIPEDTLLTKEEVSYLSYLFFKKIPAWKQDLKIQLKHFNDKIDRTYPYEFTLSEIEKNLENKTVSQKVIAYANYKYHKINNEFLVNQLKIEYLRPKLLTFLENLVDEAKEIVKLKGTKKEKNFKLFNKFLEYLDLETELGITNTWSHVLLQNCISLRELIKQQEKTPEILTNSNFLRKEQEFSSIKILVDKNILENRINTLKSCINKLEEIPETIEEKFIDLLVKRLPETLKTELIALIEDFKETDLGKDLELEIFSSDLEEKFDEIDLQNLIQEISSYLMKDKNSILEFLPKKVPENKTLRIIQKQKETLKNFILSSPKVDKIKKSLEDFIEKNKLILKENNVVKFQNYNSETDLENLILDLIPGLILQNSKTKENFSILNLASLFNFDNSDIFVSWYTEIASHNMKNLVSSLENEIKEFSEPRNNVFNLNESNLITNIRKGAIIPFADFENSKILLNTYKDYIKELTKEEIKQEKELKELKNILFCLQKNLDITMLRQASNFEEIKNQKRMKMFISKLNPKKQIKSLNTIQKNLKSLENDLQNKNTKIILNLKDEFISSAKYMEILIEKQKQLINLVETKQKRKDAITNTLIEFKNYNQLIKKLEIYKRIQKIKSQLIGTDLLKQLDDFSLKNDFQSDDNSKTLSKKELNSKEMNSTNKTFKPSVTKGNEIIEGIMIINELENERENKMLNPIFNSWDLQEVDVRANFENKKKDRSIESKMSLKGLSTESLNYPIHQKESTLKEEKAPIHFYFNKNSKGKIEHIIPVETNEKAATKLWFKLKSENPSFKHLSNKPKFIKMSLENFIDRTNHLEFETIKIMTLKNT